MFPVKEKDQTEAELLSKAEGKVEEGGKHVSVWESSEGWEHMDDKKAEMIGDRLVTEGASTGENTTGPPPGGAVYASCERGAGGGRVASCVTTLGLVGSGSETGSAGDSLHDAGLFMEVE